MGRLTGKVAVITGAAGGIGLAATELFAREGAKVVAVDVQEEPLKAAVAKIHPGEGEIATHPLDISSEESWKTAVEFTRTTFGGRIDVLVNNAAIGNFTPMQETTTDEWLSVLAVNVVGPAMGIKTVSPIMIEQGSGSIVNTSSCSALTPDLTVGPIYAAAKGAIVPLTKHEALALAPHGIRVNAVVPGAIWTTGIQNLGISHVEMAERFKDKSPLPPHAGLPAYVANAYLYLASDDACFVTGVTLPVDAGNTM